MSPAQTCVPLWQQEAKVHDEGLGFQSHYLASQNLHVFT